MASPLPDPGGGYGSLYAALSERIAQCGRGGARFGVLLVGPEHLYRTYAHHGHLETAAWLDAVEARLARALRPQDRLLRCGEGRFAILTADLRNEGHALLAANKVREVAEQPVKNGSGEIALGVVVGVSLFPDHGGDVERLLQCAELAWQSALGGDKAIAVYGAGLDREIEEELRLEHGLDKALENDGLSMHYQPKLMLGDGRPCGAEALMRWQRAGHGFVPPDRFIPLAERSGKIFALTRFAINTAVRQLCEWPASRHPPSVAVNVSARVAQNSELVDMVRTAAAIWSVPLPSLTVEVTETALMSDTEASHRVLGALREIGCRVSIDDFGTGYSYLSSFRNLPADELKIDKSFVQSMRHASADLRIVENVIALAHSFDLTVVAEGVEDGETFAMLSKLGCDCAQGYYFSRPLPQEELIAWLAQRNAGAGR